MLARSRSKGWILAAFVVLIVGVAWRLRPAHESSALDPPVPIAATGLPPSRSDTAPLLERAPTAEVEVPAAPSSAARESAPTDPDFELKQAIWIEGQVIIPPGTPSDEHVEVIASGSRFENRPMHRCPVAADGMFRVAFARGTEVGTLELSARYLYLENTSSIWMSDPSRLVTLRPKLGGCVRGRFVLPLAGLNRRDTLVGSSIKATSLSNAILCSTTVDQDLAFEIGGVPPNRRFRVQLDAAEFLEPDMVFGDVQPGAVLTIEIDLGMAARVLGTVVDPSGQPIHCARVHGTQVVPEVAKATPFRVRGVEHDALTDLDGAFELSHLEPGSWVLEASAQNWSAAPEARLDLQPGESVQRLELVLRRAGRIAGRVVRNADKPATHTHVALIPVPEPDSEPSGSRRQSPSMETDAYGTFEFEGLSPGSYRIEAQCVPPAVPTGTASLGGITLREGGDIDDLILHLGPFARIEGTVFGPDGVPVSGARVWRPGSVHLGDDVRVVTDATGHFKLEGVPAGEGTLRAQTAAEDLDSSVSYSIRSGEFLHVDIRLQARTRVVIVVKGGQRASSVVVSVEDEHGRPVEIQRLVGYAQRETTGVRSEQKHAMQALLPRGRYTILAAAADGWTDRRDIEVSERAFPTVTFDVPE